MEGLIKLGYKVTTKNNKSSSFDEASQWSIQYLPYRWVQPNPDCGPLVVMTDKHMAEFNALMLAGRDYNLWSCEYILAKRQNLIWLPIYRGEYDTANIYNIKKAYPSSVFAAGVRLLERIW